MIKLKVYCAIKNKNNIIFQRTTESFFCVIHRWQIIIAMNNHNYSGNDGNRAAGETKHGAWHMEFCWKTKNKCLPTICNILVCKRERNRMKMANWVCVPAAVAAVSFSMKVFIGLVSVQLIFVVFCVMKVIWCELNFNYDWHGHCASSTPQRGNGN